MVVGKVYIISHRRLLPLTPFFPLLPAFSSSSFVDLVLNSYPHPHPSHRRPNHQSHLVIRNHHYTPPQHPSFQAHKIIQTAAQKQTKKEQATNEKQKRERNRTAKSYSSQIKIVVLKPGGGSVRPSRLHPIHCMSNQKESQQTNEATKEHSIASTWYHPAPQANHHPLQAGKPGPKKP